MPSEPALRAASAPRARAKSRPAVWRDAIRDSDLDRTAKLIALILSTYMNAAGVAWPSQATLAKGASLTDKPVHAATLVLERAGFLRVDWSRGKSSHRYTATLSPTSDALRRSEWATSELVPPTSELVPFNIGAAPNESSTKARESGDRRRNNLRPVDDCMRCTEKAPLNRYGDELVCDKCLALLPF